MRQCLTHKLTRHWENSFPLNGNLNYFNISIRAQSGKQALEVSERGFSMRPAELPPASEGRAREGECSSFERGSQELAQRPRVSEHWKFRPLQLVAVTPVGLKTLPPACLAVDSSKAGDLQEI